MKRSIDTAFRQRRRGAPASASAAGTWATGLALALTSCGSSPPIRYYSLEATTAPVSGPAAAGDRPAMSNVVPVRLGQLSIPRELDRPELVIRGGPYRLDVLDSERWAAPLDDQIRRVLSDDLAGRLPYGLVADPYEPASNEPRRTLSVDILELTTDGLCSATLRAEWILQGPNQQMLSGGGRFRARGVECSAPVPAAISAALAALAEGLAAKILTGSPTASPAP